MRAGQTICSECGKIIEFYDVSYHWTKDGVRDSLCYDCGLNDSIFNSYCTPEVKRTSKTELRVAEPH